MAGEGIEPSFPGSKSGVIAVIRPGRETMEGPVGFEPTPRQSQRRMLANYTMAPVSGPELKWWRERELNPRHPAYETRSRTSARPALSIILEEECSLL